MSADFQYDVFLSHNSADKPRVRRLAERLRAASAPNRIRISDFGLRISAEGGLGWTGAHRHKEPIANCDLESA